MIKWNEMFEKLKAYKHDHGDCLVPKEYEDKSLGQWVMMQRTERKANRLAAERKAKLDSIGFVWEPDEQKWNEMLENDPPLEGPLEGHAVTRVANHAVKDRSSGS